MNQKWTKQYKKYKLSKPVILQKIKATDLNRHLVVSYWLV